MTQRLATLPFAVLTLAATAAGQTTTAAVLGPVTDSQTGVIRDVTVTLRTWRPAPKYLT